LLHVLRRNVDLQIILFNNEIYGLTKGQFSPTSRRGTRSPSTPQGSIDAPLIPAAFALGAGARFVARTIDTMQQHQVEVLKRAHAHHGASFVEIYQNCVVFNDGVFEEFTDKSVATEAQLHAEHGRPLVFGKDSRRGLHLRPGTLDLEVVTVGEDGVSERDVLVHDQTNRTLAMMLAGLQPPAFPMVLGVLYCDPRPSYDSEVRSQIPDHASVELDALLRSGDTWTVLG
jgi:2-oxoglutarate ferredoxin oxidoreductase subunit beta